jgi:hypothetical protein
LLKAPRYVLVFRWQKPTSKIKVTVDASHAGCVRTRKSTTCVVVRLGNHMIQDLSETQGTIRLSSGEAEYAGLVRGSQEGLYVKNLLRFFGRSAEVELETDSSSALGTVRRLGPGKRLRHVETEYFFLQSLVREGIIKVTKIKGEDNVADLGTKHLAWPRMAHLLKMLSVRIVAATGAVLVPAATAAPTGNAMVTEETARGFLQNDYAKLYAVMAGVAALATVCVWGLGRLRRKTHAGKTVNAIVSKLAEEKTYVTTASGARMHLYADCKSLEQVWTVRQKEWTVCNHCKREEEKRSHDIADAIVELLEANA